jgi:hypothetical protein
MGPADPRHPPRFGRLGVTRPFCMSKAGTSDDSSSSEVHHLRLSGEFPIAFIVALGWLMSMGLYYYVGLVDRAPTCQPHAPPRAHTEGRPDRCHQVAGHARRTRRPGVASASRPACFSLGPGCASGPSLYPSLAIRVRMGWLERPLAYLLVATHPFRLTVRPDPLRRALRPGQTSLGQAMGDMALRTASHAVGKPLRSVGTIGVSRGNGLGGFGRLP